MYSRGHKTILLLCRMLTPLPQLSGGSSHRFYFGLDAGIHDWALYRFRLLPDFGLLVRDFPLRLSAVFSRSPLLLISGLPLLFFPLPIFLLSLLFGFRLPVFSRSPLPLISGLPVLFFPLPIFLSTLSSAAPPSVSESDPYDSPSL